MTALAKLKSQVTMPRMTGGNVANIRDYKVQDVYKSFLGIHGNNSEKTALEYDKRVREFFRLTLDKDIEHVTLDDIQSITKSDVQNKYIDKLMENENQGNTIKTKLNSVRSFYNELLSNDLSVNPMIFKIKISTDVQHVNSLSFEELGSLYKFMLEEEKEMGLEKYLFLKTLFTTGNRKTATLNMTWRDNFLRKTDVETGQKVWVVKVIDKGKKIVEKPIPDEFYEELQQLNRGQDKVFAISSKTIERSLERFSEKIGKKITIHSMKSTGVTYGYSLYKDINLCKQYASHEDISTTAIYLRDESSYTKQLSYNLSRTLDESILEDMSHEELLEFILDKKNEDIKNSILLRLHQ